jgi:hypothetical protein
MAFNTCAVWGLARKQLLAAAALALLAPAAAWANNTPIVCNPATVCIANDKGTLSGTSSGLTLTGSVVTQIGDKFGTNLGTLSLSTGALASGSLMQGGTFAAGGSIQITEGSAVLFSGTFSNPVNWTVTGLMSKIVNHKTVYFCSASTGCVYVLSGTMTGTYGPNGLPVSGATIQQTLTTKKPFTGGALTIENGSTFIVTPEPSTLSLMGTGLLGLAGLVKRRLVRNKPLS